MRIATQKRKENIIEYILYLWQLEDLLRALKFNADAISNTLCRDLELSDAEKDEMLNWYLELGSIMKEEGKMEKGHISHTMHLIEDLEDLHARLLKNTKEQKYHALWQFAAGAIEELRKKMETYPLDIEVCFRCLYSVMLLSLKGDKDLTVLKEEVSQSITPLINHLATVFHKIEAGTYELEEA